MAEAAGGFVQGLFFGSDGFRQVGKSTQSQGVVRPRGCVYLGRDLDHAAAATAAGGRIVPAVKPGGSPAHSDRALRYPVDVTPTTQPSMGMGSQIKEFNKIGQMILRSKHSIAGLCRNTPGHLTTASASRWGRFLCGHPPAASILLASMTRFRVQGDLGSSEGTRAVAARCEANCLAATLAPMK